MIFLLSKLLNNNNKRISASNNKNQYLCREQISPRHFHLLRHEIL